MVSAWASGPKGRSLVMVAPGPTWISSPGSIRRQPASSSIGSLAITTERTSCRSSLSTRRESEDCSRGSRGSAAVAERSSTHSSLVAGSRTAISSSPRMASRFTEYTGTWRAIQSSAATTPSCRSSPWAATSPVTRAAIHSLSVVPCTWWAVPSSRTRAFIRSVTSRTPLWAVTMPSCTKGWVFSVVCWVPLDSRTCAIIERVRTCWAIRPNRSDA